MWQRVEHIIGKNAPKPQKPARDISSLSLGSVVEFTALAPSSLAGMRAQVRAIRTYRFGADTTLTYGITLSNGERYFMSVARDEEGSYIGVMRELSSAEQRQWFDPDALSFFTEPSSAKSLPCRADLDEEADWAAPRYKKAVDFMVGDVSEGRQAATEIGRKPRRLEYSMLLDESGERALEIEVYPEHGNARIFVTRFCPEDAVKLLPKTAAFDLHEPEEAPEYQAKKPALGKAKILAMPHAEEAEARYVDDEDALGELAAAIQELNQGVEKSSAISIHADDAEPPLFSDDVAEYLGVAKPKPEKPDFRRLSEYPDANITRAADAELDEDAGPIPAFLLEPRQEPTDLLEEILQPDALQLRVDTQAAYRMLHRAIKARKPVKEMIREILGLAPSIRDEVIFELPLTERERQALAIHFQIRPDRPEELQARILREITKRLG